MSGDSETHPKAAGSAGPETVEMPQATAWPLVLAVGVTLIGAGLATQFACSVVGFGLLAAGLAGWIGQLLPGKGETHEALVEPALRPRPITGMPGTVEQLRPGTPGYRFRLPEKIHPISAGVKGGLLGGLLMPIPALLYGIVSGHGLWFPINLLAGMVVPGLAGASVEQLEEFHLGGLVLGTAIHLTFSLVFGLMLGVLLPMMPPLPGGQLIWAGLVPPLMWSGVSYGFMGIVNPLLERYVNWPWFIASQFVFGVTSAIVVINSEKVPVEPVGGPEAAAEPLPRQGGGNP